MATARAEVEALLPDGLPRRGGRAPIRGQFGVVGSIGAEDGLRVRGGPDWVRKERYTIEAVASGTPDAATMAGPMLRALFERRFKLKTHVETEQTRGVQSRRRSGRSRRSSPSAAGACEVPVGQAGRAVAQRNAASDHGASSVADVRRGAETAVRSIGRDQTARTGCRWQARPHSAQLTQMLRRRLGSGIGVTDKTGITDKFNWDLEFVVDGNAGRTPPASIHWSADAADVPRAPTIFDALEQQLGLRLEPVQVPREYLVIDAIERPGPN